MRLKSFVASTIIIIWSKKEVFVSPISSCAALDATNYSEIVAIRQAYDKQTLADNSRGGCYGRVLHLRDLMCSRLRCLSAASREFAHGIRSNGRLAEATYQQDAHPTGPARLVPATEPEAVEVFDCRIGPSLCTPQAPVPLV